MNLAQELTNPIYVVLTPNGDLLNRIGGYNEPPVFVEFLTKALEKLPSSVKVSGSAPHSRIRRDERGDRRENDGQLRCGVGRGSSSASLV